FLEERVRFAIDDAIALLDHGAADGLSQMTLPCPWWPQKERVLLLTDKAPGRELVDQRAIHLLVELEIEGVERAIRITEGGLFVRALEEPILPTEQLVRDEHRDEIDRREFFGLGVPQSGFEDGRHARETELTERAIELDEIHSESPVLRSMRSR